MSPSDQLSVLPLTVFGGGSAALSLKFDAHATALVESAHRTLKLEGLKPGNYKLEVLLSDGAGRKDRREQEFQVVDKEAQRCRESISRQPIAAPVKKKNGK